jgi:hypothetical protein
MNSITDLLSTMTPEQRQSLAAALLQEAAETPAATATAEPASSYYNMNEAVAVTFKADLSVNEKSRDRTYAERFDHVWCKGHYRVKGPKGGQYFVGRCVLGVKKHQQVKGTLRVGNKHFEPFRDGAPMDAWFRPDGASEAVLIGTLSNYRDV